jgi:hypothetical protein
MKEKRLGQKYRNWIISNGGRQQDIMGDIVKFAKSIEREFPRLLNMLKNHTNGPEINWDDSEDSDVERYYEEAVAAMKMVAPKGTEFKVLDDTTWRFVPTDDEMNPFEFSGEPGIIRYDDTGVTNLEERHVRHVMKEAFDRLKEHFINE